MITKKPFFFKGFSFIFEDEGKKIEVWQSVFSGLEKVYVDGNLVSLGRNYSTNSTSNEFEIGSNRYSTNIKIINIFKLPIVCTLIKNGTEYKRQKLIAVQVKSKRRNIYFFVRSALYFISGIIFVSFLNYYLQLSGKLVYILLWAFYSIVFSLEVFGNIKYCELLIEEEEVV